MPEFDDSRLDDPGALAAFDPQLRHLAGAGARLRVEASTAEEPLSLLDVSSRPRAVIALGPEARLLRAVLEPVAPVPFVAWPRAGLPGWVGPLDVVVVLAPGQHDEAVRAAVHEAERRGSQLILACPPRSPLTELVGRRSTVLPMTTGDELAAALVVLEALHRLGLGPAVPVRQVADAVDEVAERCSPHADVAANPAKDLALGLAEAQPLVWGGSTLAARVSRRVAEAVRRSAGVAALAADAEHLLPVMEATLLRDPFADPFEEQAAPPRPVLLVIDDGQEDDLEAGEHRELVAAADARDLRVCTISHERGTDVERYAVTLQQGRYAALYLALGLRG